MPKTLCDDGVNMAVGASAAPEPSAAPAPPPTAPEPSAPATATLTAPDPDPDPEPDDADAARLRALIADRNVEDTLRLVDRGWSAGEVLAAERATKHRSTVIDALTPDDEQEQ